MWPVGTEQNGTIYLDNLRTGRLGWATPVVDPGEYQPIMLTDGRIIYVTNTGVSANDVLTGTTVLLGHQTTFAPAARPSQVWFVYGESGRVVRPVSVLSGRPGPRTVLPRGFQLIAGTDAGLLLQGNDLASLALWQPGTPPRTLPYSRLAQAFAVSPRMVAYDTGCSDEVTSPTNIYGGNYGYSACRSMRVFDLVTGRLRSFPAPRGTIGWVPSHGGYWSASAISTAMIAAKAVVRPAGLGMAREFVLPLTGSDGRATAVPFSAAFLLSVTAWSTDGSWLFYQGPGDRMWAYQVKTGKVRSSRVGCCQYATMATFR
jgi:outer membrane protein assembly factor BamB